MLYGRAITGAVLLMLSAASFGGFGDLFKSAEGLLTGSGVTGTQAGGADLSNAQIGSGLKEALSVGAERAVALLGSQGGFLRDQQVRIPLPGRLEQAGNALRAVGYGGLVDEFELTVTGRPSGRCPRPWRSSNRRCAT